MKKSILITLVLCSLMFLTMGKSCKNKKAEEISIDVLQRQLSALTVEARTPKGVQVLSFVELSPEQLAAIDRSFDLADEKTARYGLQNQIGRASFTVFVAPSERDYNAEGVYSPAFAVPIICGRTRRDPYCDTEYNKGIFRINGQIVHPDVHYLLAAERVITEDDQFNKWIVASYTRDFENMARASVYGWEHCALLRHDRGQYDATAFHGTGGHPLLPLESGEFVGGAAAPDCARPPVGATEIICVVK